MLSFNGRPSSYLGGLIYDLPQQFMVYDLLFLIASEYVAVRSCETGMEIDEESGYTSRPSTPRSRVRWPTARALGGGPPARFRKPDRLAAEQRTVPGRP